MFTVSFNVEKSITIKKNSSDVFSTISDFSTWSNWSPWLALERDCPIERGGDVGKIGHWQSWNGEKIGEGKMELKAISGKSYLEYELSILRPMKSRSLVAFKIEGDEEQTIVSWSMVGQLPFFLFFLKKMMQVWIGSDYDRGLSMLKEWLETDKVESKIDYRDVVDKDGFYYIGLEHNSTITDMPELMKDDFNKLDQLIKNNKVASPDEVIAFYHVFDMANNKCHFTSALAYKQRPLQVEGLVEGKTSGHKAIQVIHTGSYQNLGNAWSAAMNYQRCHKLKANKKVSWYEKYINGPQEVSSGELKTEINIPVK